MEKDKILCIVGGNGVGKTEMSKYIEKKYGIRAIQSFTDRPPREKGEWGHTFISKEEFDKLPDDQMVAYTKIDDKYRYCALACQIKPMNTYIVDEKGLEMFRLLYQEHYDFKSVRIWRDEELIEIDDERKKRKVVHDIPDPSYYYGFNLVNNSTLEEFHKKIDIIVEKFFGVCKQ